MKSMVTILLFLAILLTLYWNLQTLQLSFYSWYLNFPPPKYRVVVDSEVMMTMPDGTKLATDIYRPNKTGKYPVIIIRTPYNKKNSSHRYPLIAKLYAAQGYVYLIQDVRGKFQSEGQFEPYLNEAADGHATVEWAGTQKWSNGRVALFGFSYLGSCAWLAATKPSRYLKTIVPLFICQDTYRGWFTRGVPHIKDMLFWLSKYTGRRERPITHGQVDAALRTFPAINFDSKTLGKPIPTYQDYLHHEVPGIFWEKRSSINKLGHLNIPILMFSAWYDRFLDSSIDDFQQMTTETTSLIIGPWLHNPMQKPLDYVFPKNSDFKWQFKTILDWFDAVLKEEQKESFPKVSYYSMGDNKWKESATWPPSVVREESLYFQDSKLSKEKATEEWNSSYLYDPNDPTPSIGTNMIYANGWEGPRIINQLEDRNDVLTYTSEPFQSETTLAGEITSILYISSSAQDTDFVVKIADEHPSGNAYFLKAGIQRLRYRNSLHSPELITPGDIYQIEIPLGHIAYTFKAGHRLKCYIMSANYPSYSRHTNTAKSPEFSQKAITAKQTIYGGPKHPSKLILHVTKEMKP